MTRTPDNWIERRDDGPPYMTDRELCEEKLCGHKYHCDECGRPGKGEGLCPECARSPLEREFMRPGSKEIK